MTQNGRTFLNSRWQAANKDIVLSILLLTDIRLIIIPWKFHIDISYSSGDVAVWNVYFKDLKYISRPLDYIFRILQIPPFRILQIPAVRIPHFTDFRRPAFRHSAFYSSAIYRFHSVPHFADSIPFRRIQTPSSNPIESRWMQGDAQPQQAYFWWMNTWTI